LASTSWWTSPLETFRRRVTLQKHRRFEGSAPSAWTPGSAAVFELITPVPGKYLIVDHALFRVPKGAAGFMHVDQTEDWPDDIFSPDPSTLL